MKKQILLVALVSLILSACHTSEHFTKRRYTSGHYVSWSSKKQTVQSTDTKRQSASSASAPSPVATTLHKTLFEKASQEPSTEVMVLKPQVANSQEILASAKTGAPPVVPKTKKALESHHLALAKTSLQKAGSPTTAPGDKSLLGLVLAGVGLVLNLTGLLVAGLTLQYFFVAFTLAGIVCGILALLFGIKGLSLYKQEKSKGTKHTKTMIYSIISTALGGAAILLGLVYTIMGLIIISL